MSKLFTVSAFKNIKQTGSLFRSSKFLAKKLTISLLPEKPLTILELGAGDGVITKQILSKINSQSKLYSYEINNLFLPKLEAINDNRLTILNRCVSTITDDFNVGDIDIIISSLPLTNIDYAFKKQLMTDIKVVLKPEGQFIQYQYTKNDKNLLKGSFSKFNTNFCLLNVPPAFIYTCIN